MAEENKTSLIDITYKLEDIINAIQESGGEVTDETFAELEEFRGKFELKAGSIAYVVKNVMQSRVDRLKQLKKQADEKLKQEENAQERLKAYLLKAMQATNTQNLKTDLYTIYRKQNADKIIVVDEKLIPAKFTITETTVKIDKKALNDAVKRGEEVPGVVIEPGDESLGIR